MLFMRLTIIAFLVVVGLMALPPLYHLSQGNLPIDETLPPEAKADAAMVFTGSTDRLAEGYETYLEGDAEKIMITGKDYPRDAKGAEARKLSKKVRKDAVYVDIGAKNTIENAQDGAEWAIKNHVKSILLITTEGHMPRAFFELRRLLPEDVKVYTNPVPGSLHYSGLDSETGRLLCRLYETTTDSSFCYKTRKIVQNLGM